MTDGRVKEIPQAPQEKSEVKFSGELRNRYEKVRPHVKRALFGITYHKEISEKRKTAFIAADSLMQEITPILNQGKIDKLTGLTNKETFNELYRHEVVRAKQSGENLMVLFLDLNRFKQVNDKFGHSFGDTIISEIASVIKNSIRPTDVAGRTAEEAEENNNEGIAARSGGDEFTVLVRNATEEVAVKIFERISSRLSNIPHYRALAEKGINIGIACGAARVDLNDPEKALVDADQSMYAAKKIGRRRKNNSNLQIANRSSLTA